MPSTTQTAQEEAARIIALGRGYWSAKAVLTAVELDLFSLLAEQPATVQEVCERLALHQRATADFLDSLVALGVLQRDGERYRNSPAAERHLDRRKPQYLGGRLRMLNWQYSVWGKLGDLLRTGKQQSEAHSFDDLYSRPEAVRQFMSAMDGANADIGPALAKAFDWQERKSFVDVGGARGNLAADLVDAHPHLAGGTFDLPPVAPFFAEHMETRGLTGKVTFYPGDFFADPLPSTDVLIFGHVLHDWDELRRMALLGKAYEALPEGGCVLVYDALIDGARSVAENLLLSLNMRLVTPGGSEYTGAECQTWMERAGFTDVSIVPLTANDSVVIGHKRA